MENGRILKGGVGTGKSRTALAYFLSRECDTSFPVNGVGDWGQPKKPRDLYIITTAKKRDKLEWEEECVPFHLFKERENSLGGIQVKIDSWNNIAEYAEVKGAFFIFDEQRLVGSGSWVKAFLKLAKANDWIVLSATPGDSWMDYIPVLVANGYYKNRTEFIRRHVVYNNYGNFPKVDHFVEEARLEKLRRLLIVDMPYYRHTKRHTHVVPVDYDEEKYQQAFKDRWHVFEERPIKDVAELFAVIRKITNSDMSRLGAVMETMEKHPKLIIFYNFNYELEILRTLGPVLGIESREWNGHKHEELPTGDRWIYLVQYTAGAEGWNCTTTDAIAFWSLNYSYKIWEQAKGRIDRLNTPFIDLHYYVLRSMAGIDRMISKALSQKQNFNERDMQPTWAKTELDLAA